MLLVVPVGDNKYGEYRKSAYPVLVGWSDR